MGASHRRTWRVVLVYHKVMYTNIEITIKVKGASCGSNNASNFVSFNLYNVVIYILQS